MVRLDFLRAIFGYNNYLPWIEIRAFSKDMSEVTTKRFMTCKDADDYVNNLPLSDHHVFFGVLPRSRRYGAATKDTIRKGAVLWADIDAKRFSSKVEAAASWSNYAFAPNIVIDTGNGYHCYWLLEDVCHNMFDLETANYKLQRLLQSDSVHDATRILRLPLTYNVKHDVAKPTEIVRWQLDTRYSLDCWLEPGETINHVTKTGKIEMEPLPADGKHIPLSHIPDKNIREYVRYGIAKDDGRFGNDRDRMDMLVVAYLKAQGWPFERIVATMQYDCYGISSKSLEMPIETRTRYLNRMYARAGLNKVTA